MPFLDKPEIPRGPVLKTCRTRQEAQQIVKYLSGQGVPASALSIIGRDVSIVERMHGAGSWAAAAGRGAMLGVWMGVLLSLVFSFTRSADSFEAVSVLPAMLVGVGLGMLWGIATRALAVRRGAMVSQPQIIAAHYDVVCSPARAAQARELMAKR